jgi:linoleoyl-CoA desaturase
VPQVYSAWHKVVRLSLPNNWLATTTWRNLPEQLGVLWKMTTGDRAVRRALQKRLDYFAAGAPGEPEPAPEPVLLTLGARPA